LLVAMRIQTYGSPIVRLGLHCQPDSAFTDMDVSDVLDLTLLADATGVRVFRVPRFDSDEAQGHEGHQRSKELGSWHCSAPFPAFLSQ
jgi:hypothetical protein